jgi:hypothetical protein
MAVRKKCMLVDGEEEEDPRYLLRESIQKLLETRDFQEHLDGGPHSGLPLFLQMWASLLLERALGLFLLLLPFHMNFPSSLFLLMQPFQCRISSLPCSFNRSISD